MDSISYYSGYKYQLAETYTVGIGIIPPAAISTEYINLDIKGNLTMKRGYAWDGPSGPTFDTLTFRRGSLVHDALYQLMREDHLGYDTNREAADRTLQKICREDGMNSLRAWWVYHAVRLFGEPSADPDDKKPVIIAPKGKP